MTRHQMLALAGLFFLTAVLLLVVIRPPHMSDIDRYKKGRDDGQN